MLSKKDAAIVKALEVTPPGMEPVVRALKKKSDVDNPWAVAWAMKGKSKTKRRGKQAASSGAFSALLRGQDAHNDTFKCSKRGVSENATPISVVQSDPLDGPDAFEGQRLKVTLISQGLGNRRDMNYYGPEAIDSAPRVFEGAHCFLNHPSFSEERDIPERRVQDLCGYFKNVQVDVIDGQRCVTGELHFDLSEAGRAGYDKACTALHYQTEFPGSDREYVGLSVNADGKSEPRRINIDGEDADVHYVTEFTTALSCDIVTLPARGGKILALVESAAGADMKHKEVRAMLVKRLQAAQNALKEAATIQDPEKRKKALSESQKIVDAILKDALDAANRSKTKESETETETESETDMESDDMESEGEDAADAVPAPGHKIKKSVTTTVHHAKDGSADDEDEEEEDESKGKESETESEAYEANRLAVKHLIAESGLEPELFDAKELAHRGLKEARREISRMKRVAEAWTKRALKAVGDVSPAHAAKLSESGKSGKVQNTDLFADCSL